MVGQTDDGRTEHEYTISSPCEPEGSGELKTVDNIKTVHNMHVSLIVFSC